MNVLHVPRILLLNLALVKVLAVHAVSATLTLVHVGVCCVVSLEVLFAQAFTTWRKVTVAIACPMPRRLIVVELVAARLQTRTTTQSLRVPPSLGNDKALGNSLSQVNTISFL